MSLTQHCEVCFIRLEQMQIHEHFSRSQATEVTAEIKRKLEKKDKKKKKREKRKLEALSTAEGDEEANGDAEVLVNNTSSVSFSTGVFRLGSREC